AYDHLARLLRARATRRVASIDRPRGSMMARRLLYFPAMPDMVMLARLHAALDSVVESEQMIATIREVPAPQPPVLARVGELLDEARRLLRAALVRTETRHLEGRA